MLLVSFEGRIFSFSENITTERMAFRRFVPDIHQPKNMNIIVLTKKKMLNVEFGCRSLFYQIFKRNHGEKKNSAGTPFSNGVFFFM